MRPQLASALRWLLPRRPRARPREPVGPEAPPEAAAEFSADELEEFLRGDQAPVQADPAYRERLRAELWELVEALYPRTRHGDSRRD